MLTLTSSWNNILDKKTLIMFFQGAILLSNRHAFFHNIGELLKLLHLTYKSWWLVKLSKFQIFFVGPLQTLKLLGVTMVLLQSTPTKLLQVSTLVIHNSFKMQNFYYILLSIEHLVQLFFHLIVTTIFFYSDKQSCLSTCAQTFMFKGFVWRTLQIILLLCIHSPPIVLEQMELMDS
jgi:hypothetical protein